MYARISLVEILERGSTVVVAASSVNVILNSILVFTSNESYIVTVRVKDLLEDSRS